MTQGTLLGPRVIIRKLHPMEKYIFDCRSSSNECPKFLNRNHKLAKTPSISTNLGLPYRICTPGVNFNAVDYSFYYQTQPQVSHYAQPHKCSINALFADSDKLQLKERGPEQGGNAKWKKQKEHSFSLMVNQTKKQFFAKNKKNGRDRDCVMPTVGQYDYEPEVVQKRITYNVKIRGRAQRPNKYTTEPTKQSMHLQSPIRTAQKQNEEPCRPPPMRSLMKQRKSCPRNRKTEQQYVKFLSTIETVSVWEKLMQKHRLKGTKFDLYSTGP